MSKKSRPLLNISSIVVNHFGFTAVEDYDEDAPSEGELQMWFGIARHEESEQLFSVQLKVEVKQAEVVSKINLPYIFSVEARGYFSTHLRIPDNNFPETLAGNALAVLYGSLRGYVLSATSMSFNGPLVLPGVALNDLVKGADNVMTDDDFKARRTVSDEVTATDVPPGDEGKPVTRD